MRTYHFHHLVIKMTSFFFPVDNFLSDVLLKCENELVTKRLFLAISSLISRNRRQPQSQTSFRINRVHIKNDINQYIICRLKQNEITQGKASLRSLCVQDENFENLLKFFFLFKTSNLQAKMPSLIRFIEGLNSLLSSLSVSMD